MIYVDPLFDWAAAAVNDPQAARLTRKYGKWCHMTADNEQELRAFARRIGLRVEWIQHPGTPDVHFDLVPPRRARAVQLGAKEITRVEAVEMRRRRRLQLEAHSQLQMGNL